MGRGLMSNRGIGWFKLDLVTYPEDASFIDVTFDDKYVGLSSIKYDAVKFGINKNEHKDVSKIDKDTEKQIVINKKDNDVAIIEKNIAILSSLEKETVVIAK